MIADPRQLRPHRGHLLTAEQQCAISERARDLVEQLAQHPTVVEAIAPKAREHRTDRIAAAARGVPALRRLLAEAQRLWWDLAVSELRVARREARRHARGRVREEDLYQEGVYGLQAAARRFDPGRGVKFAHHAGWWCRARIRRVLGEDRAVTVSPNTSAVVRQVLELERIDPKLTREGAARLLRVSPELVTAACIAEHVVSTEQPLDDTDRSTIGDTLVAEPWHADEDLDEHAERIRLRAALDGLPERARLAMQRRLEGQTYAQIGVEIGCSRERIRQILCDAEDRLRGLVAS